MTASTTAERLEELEGILQELVADNEECPVLVEGERDAAALRALGLRGEILRVKGADTVFVVCETLARRYRKAIVLTDWDRGGGHLARLLQDALEANGVRYDLAYRRTLARATRREVVHVESLAAYVAGLRRAVERREPGRRGRGPNP